MRYVIASVLALSSVACSQGSSIESALPGPTLMQTANALCETQITGLNLDVEYSGPHLLIDISFASAPSPVEIEIERYQADGRTEPVAHLTDVVGRTRIALNFNSRYRGRARAGSCSWSPWVDQQVGSANPCADCKTAPPPPPLPECQSNQEALRRMQGPPPPPECSSQ